MARRRNREEVSIELDSFLDILTNSIGIIVVITVVAILNSTHMTFIFRTPYARGTEKEPLYFECGGDRVTFVDKKKIDTELEDYRNSIKELDLNDLQVQKQLESGIRVVESAHYRVDLGRFAYNNVVVLVPKEARQGENINQIVLADSDYQKLVDKIDPEKHFVFFLVRPDSYEVFRKARQILWDRGIQGGWEPLEIGQQITFGSKGRKAVID